MTENEEAAQQEAESAGAEASAEAEEVQTHEGRAQSADENVQTIPRAEPDPVHERPEVTQDQAYAWRAALEEIKKRSYLDGLESPEELRDWLKTCHTMAKQALGQA